MNEAVIEKSAYIYRKLHERALIRGRSMSALIATVLYVAGVKEPENKTQHRRSSQCHRHYYK